jgi:hypothetical protein
MAAGDGLISMAPTSIAYSGTSAGINADGGVDFSAVTSLSLNGVFTSDYDNYLVIAQWTSSSAGAFVELRFRLSGTDATGSNYTYQALEANSTSVAGARVTDTYGRSARGSTARTGYSWHIYGPALAQPTAYRSVSGSDFNSAYLLDYAGTHSLSTAYDGITYYPSAGNITGNVHVFGYEE